MAFEEAKVLNCWIDTEKGVLVPKIRVHGQEPSICLFVARSRLSSPSCCASHARLGGHAAHPYPPKDRFNLEWLTDKVTLVSLSWWREA